MTWSARFNRLMPLLPNSLSCLRGLIGLFLPILLNSSQATHHLAAGLLFSFGTLTDYWDGVLARRYHQVTNFGKILDPTMDKILILAPLAAFAVKGFYPLGCVVLIFAREIVVTFCRIGWLMEGNAVAAERLGKWKFAFQAIALGFAFLLLLAYDFSFPSSILVSLRFLLWFCLLIALGLTLVSGISFAVANRENFKSAFFAQFSSALGVGLIPYIPGTWGSLLGLGLVFLVHWNAWLYGLVILGLVAFGHWACSRLDLSSNHDPSFVVVDEAVGMMISFCAIPLTVPGVLTGFILFRLLDIFKPYPLHQLEKIRGYWGILLDDVGAGVYTWLILAVLFLILQP